MKRKSREINIFSMSALDLFASAMGAFVIIAVIMFPYFPNTGDSPERVATVRAEMEAEMRQLQAQMQAEIDAVTAQLQQAQSDLANCRAQNASLQGQVQQCQAQLAQVQQALQECRQGMTSMQNQLTSCRAELEKTYIVIAISWPTSGDDVDLHVVDPLGREYYYNAREFPNSEARLEEDNTNGPGNEIWQHPNATPGEYKIYYTYFNNPAGSTEVRGFVLHADGRETLPVRRLTRQGEKPLIATLVVDNEGNVRLR